MNKDELDRVIVAEWDENPWLRNSFGNLAAWADYRRAYQRQQAAREDPGASADDSITLAKEQYRTFMQRIKMQAARMYNNLAVKCGSIM